TMLRALRRFLGTEIPVVGVNFGRVGFLASIQPNELESGLARVFSGDYRVVHLTTLEVAVGGSRAAAINDVVVLSSIKGRMVELAWAIGGEDMGGHRGDGRRESHFGAASSAVCSPPSPKRRASAATARRSARSSRHDRGSDACGFGRYREP